MDFTGVTSITIPEGNVTKITKENGVILWKKADTNYHQNLKCYLSASNNTRNGYNESATTWEDLSGNNNDFTLTTTVPVLVCGSLSIYSYCKINKCFSVEKCYHSAST